MIFGSFVPTDSAFLNTLFAQYKIANPYEMLGRLEDGIRLTVDVLEKGEKAGVSASFMQTRRPNLVRPSRRIPGPVTSHPLFGIFRDPTFYQQGLLHHVNIVVMLHLCSLDDLGRSDARRKAR